MANDLGDLRRSALEELEAEQSVARYEDYMTRRVVADRLFGMTAIERMFVSIGCFILTSLGGFLLLLVMEKIAL